jgi:hypothetical protein
MVLCRPPRGPYVAAHWGRQYGSKHVSSETHVHAIRDVHIHPAHPYRRHSQLFQTTASRRDDMLDLEGESSDRKPHPSEDERPRLCQLCTVVLVDSRLISGANVRPDMYGVAAYMARERGSARVIAFALQGLTPRTRARGIKRPSAIALIGNWCRTPTRLDKNRTRHLRV